MINSDSSNQYFHLAARFINQTGQSVFLTGKAGTGKTTFLKFIKETTFKKTVVVAPTGVAAINAGGVTMHSFFQLPFGPYIPVSGKGWNNNSNNRDSLFKNIRFNAEKRELLGELELLIIDEVSMVRADMLDATDAILRHFRKQPHLPFGGVQVLFIGDLYQLPPVINNEDWELLAPYYKSPFFFDAQVLQDSPPVYIELKKIYRQSEALFINILNNIRNNIADHDDLEQLHRYFKPGFEPPADEHYITLTTHNRTADLINQGKLRKLPGEMFLFRGELKGDFNEKALPAELELQLKVGAQIMFIKNDKGEARRYFNGRIASVSRIEKEEIFAVFPGESTEMQLEKETWKNIRYSYNREKDEMEEEELGSFTQYPVRLAWAITIHKSQGLTFERAVIDAGASFAPGQVYVALSRLTSLDGLVLYSKIFPQSIKTDERVIAFSQNEVKEELMESMLEQEQKIFIGQSLVKSFNWQKISDAMEIFMEDFEHRLIPDKHAAMQWAGKIASTCQEQKDIAHKFDRQLAQLLTIAEADNYKELSARVSAAVNYFSAPLEDFIKSIQDHIKEYRIKQRTRKYLHELADLLLLFERKKQSLKQSLLMAEGLMKGTDTSELLQQVLAKENKPAPVITETISAVKPKKGETRSISLAMFKEGKTTDEIAAMRSLTKGTIEGHLLEFIKTGEVDVTAFIAAEKIEAILKTVNETGAAVTSVYKEKLGDDYSYNEIKAALYWKEKEQPAN